MLIISYHEENHAYSRLIARMKVLLKQCKLFLFSLNLSFKYVSPLDYYFCIEDSIFEL